MRRSIVHLILVAFLANCLLPPSYAQSPAVQPGEMASLSSAFHPPILSGLKVYPNEPFRFDFILDRGDLVSGDSRFLQDESNRLIKYFLASLTVPEEDLWVNLSPYEQDRIVPEAFGQTEMGRDLLSQDYFLKQITSSLMFPDGELGKKFWAKVYKEAQERFGTTDVPMDTFNKVWITPDKAVVYEKGSVVYVVESRFKVLLESDYLAIKHQAAVNARPGCAGDPGSPECAAQELSKQVIREIIIPALEKEVNEGSNFTRLRQVYHSLILASWYKKKIKASLLSQVYVDQNKVQGVNVDDPRIAKKIWDDYVVAFKKGVFNLIREERDAMTDELIPRKYFSGGITLRGDFDQAQAVNVTDLPRNALVVQAQLDRAQGPASDRYRLSELVDFLGREDLLGAGIVRQALRVGTRDTLRAFRAIRSMEVFERGFKAIAAASPNGAVVLREAILAVTESTINSIIAVGTQPDMIGRLSAVNVLGPRAVQDALENDAVELMNLLTYLGADGRRMPAFERNINALMEAGVPSELVRRSFILMPSLFGGALSELDERGMRVFRENYIPGTGVNVSGYLQGQKVDLVLNNRNVSSLNAAEGLIEMLQLSENVVVGITDQVEEQFERVKARFAGLRVTDDLTDKIGDVVSLFRLSFKVGNDELVLPGVPFKIHLPQKDTRAAPDKEAAKRQLGLDTGRRAIMISSVHDLNELDGFWQGYATMANKPLVFLAMRNPDDGKVARWLQHRGYRFSLAARNDIREDMSAYNQVDVVVVNTRGELRQIGKAMDAWIVTHDRDLSDPVGSYVQSLYLKGYWPNNRMLLRLFTDAGVSVPIVENPALLGGQLEQAYGNQMVEKVNHSVDLFESRILPAARLSGALAIVAMTEHEKAKWAENVRQLFVAVRDKDVKAMKEVFARDETALNLLNNLHIIEFRYSGIPYALSEKGERYRAEIMRAIESYGEHRDHIRLLGDLRAILAAQLPNAPEGAQSKDAAQNVDQILQGIKILSEAQFEKNSPADMLKWVQQVADSTDRVLSEAEVDLIAKSLGLSAPEVDRMKRENRARALAGAGFFDSLQMDQKTNVYLLRDGVMLYLAERIMGEKEPRAVYLSKGSLEVLSQDKATALLYIPAMIAEAKARAGFPEMQMLPAGEENLVRFKNEFYRLYQEIISDQEVKTVGIQAAGILKDSQARIKSVAEALRVYLEKEGVLSREAGQQGVRFIDTTMTGTLPLFAEAVVRSALESYGYKDTNQRVDSRMFYSSLSEDLGFLKQEKKRYARALELMTYPFQFTRRMTSEGPEIVLSGDRKERTEFILQVILFKSELLKLMALQETAGAETAAVTFRDTGKDRNRSLLQLMGSEDFYKRTQLDLKQGEILVGDVGGGPVTPLDTKEALGRLNPGIRMVVTEVPENAVKDEVIFSRGRTFDALKGLIIAQNRIYEKGEITEVRYLRTGSGGQEFYVKFHPEEDAGNPRYVTVAASPGVRFMVQGIDFVGSNMMNNVPLFLDMINTVGTDRVEQMIAGLGDQVSRRIESEGEEVLVNREPVRQELERAGIEYLETRDIAASGMEQRFDLLTVSNVVSHLNEQGRRELFEMMGKALRENGVLVVNNEDLRVRGRKKDTDVSRPSKMDVYKRVNGVLVYLGSAVAYGASPVISREAFDKYYEFVRGANLFMPFEAELKYLFDTGTGDRAMLQNGVTEGNKGGIDLTPGMLELQTRGDGTDIRYNINPALIEQYRSTSGFVPVIINIMPMKDLPRFLGVESRPASSLAA